jgi:hypothetical protein
MEVSDDRHRAGARTGRRVERGTAVAPVLTSRRVGPVEGRIDQEQVWQEVAALVDQVVDPFRPHGNAHLGLDGERRVVEGLRMGDGPAPDGGGGQARRQDLLAELADGDLVIANPLALLGQQ